MVNQNPQPEIWNTRHQFAGDGASTTQGNTVQQVIYTNQAHNEECRIYAIQVQPFAYDLNWQGGGAGKQGGYIGNQWEIFEDYTISVQVGSNSIPNQTFDLSEICRRDDKTMYFSAPILVLHRQPLQVSVSYNGSLTLPNNTDTVVSVNLIGETYIAQA